MKITSKQKGFRSYFDLSPQIPTRMKIAALCLTCFLSAANANSLYSQSARLSIEMNNVSIEEVLNKIEENSEFHFIYNNELVNVDRKVNVKFDNETIESILKKVFKSTNVEYKVNEKQIILRPKEMDIVAKVQQEQKTVKGVVSDQFGPIAGANVSIQGTTVGTITDMDGNFTIEVPENATLQISFIGYNTCFVKVAGQSNLNVTLTEDTQKLDEVVVIGYGTQKKMNLTGSSPLFRQITLRQSRFPISPMRWQDVCRVFSLTINPVCRVYLPRSRSVASIHPTIQIRLTSSTALFVKKQTSMLWIRTRSRTFPY